MALSEGLCPLSRLKHGACLLHRNTVSDPPPNSTCACTRPLLKIVYLCSCIYVFTCSFVKINSEEAFEVSLYAKLKADGKFLLILYI